MGFTVSLLAWIIFFNSSDLFGYIAWFSFWGSAVVHVHVIGHIMPNLTNEHTQRLIGEMWADSEFITNIHHLNEDILILLILDFSARIKSKI